MSGILDSNLSVISETRMEMDKIDNSQFTVPSITVEKIIKSERLQVLCELLVVVGRAKFIVYYIMR
jgi:hypothetical protein